MLKMRLLMPKNILILNTIFTQVKVKVMDFVLKINKL